MVPRWKQRDIHEKRETRKQKIAKLKTELSLNAILRPRITSVLEGVSSKGVDHFRAVQRRLREQPSDEKPDTGHPDQPTYDMMLSQLLSDVFRESAWMVEGAKAGADGKVMKGGQAVTEKMGQPSWADGVIPDGKKEEMDRALEGRLKWYIQDLGRRDTEAKKEIDEEEQETKKRITSDDIKEGWSHSSVAPAKPSPLEDKPKVAKPAKKEKLETIEVLNAGASVSLRSFNQYGFAHRWTSRLPLPLQPSPSRMTTTTRKSSAL